MDLPEVQSLNEFAIDTVVSIINRAKEKLGRRQTLQELAGARDNFGIHAKLNLSNIQVPVAVTAEAFILNTIVKKWRLTDTFMFVLHYKNCSWNETSHFYYYEMVFRIEGQYTEHDIRYIRLEPDWLLAIIKMKTRLAARIEKIKLF